MANVTAKNVDFSNVKDGGGFNKSRIPAGDYLATVVKVEDAESKKDNTFQYLFTIQVKSRPSSKFPYYCKLTENQLWKLRNLLIAAGISVPKKRMKVDPSRVVNKLIGISVEDTDYDGKEQSEITGVFPASELSEDVTVADDDDEAPEALDDDDDTAEEAVDDDADDEEAEEPEAEDEPEEEEAETGDEFDAMDRTALKAALKKKDASFKARTSQSDDDLRELLRAADKPAPKAKPKTTSKAKASADISDDELEELDIDNL